MSSITSIGWTRRSLLKGKESAPVEDRCHIQKHRTDFIGDTVKQLAVADCDIKKKGCYGCFLKRKTIRYSFQMRSALSERTSLIALFMSSRGIPPSSAASRAFRIISLNSVTGAGAFLSKRRYPPLQLQSQISFHHCLLHTLPEGSGSWSDNRYRVFPLHA